MASALGKIKNRLKLYLNEKVTTVPSSMCDERRHITKICRDLNPVVNEKNIYTMIGSVLTPVNIDQPLFQPFVICLSGNFKVDFLGFSCGDSYIRAMELDRFLITAANLYQYFGTCIREQYIICNVAMNMRR